MPTPERNKKWSDDGAVGRLLFSIVDVGRVLAADVKIRQDLRARLFPAALFPRQTSRKTAVTLVAL